MELIRPKKVRLSLDLAPLIDVVFQLLVFFMLTATFTNPSIRITLPSATTKDAPINQVLTISIKEDGAIFINEDQVTKEEMPKIIKKELRKQKNKAVHIKGDASMPYKYFVEVMDVSRQAGAKQVNILHKVGQ